MGGAGPGESMDGQVLTPDRAGGQADAIEYPSEEINPEDIPF